jgi:hypothetical protein
MTVEVEITEDDMAFVKQSPILDERAAAEHAIGRVLRKNTFVFIDPEEVVIRVTAGGVQYRCPTPPELVRFLYHEDADRKFPVRFTLDIPEWLLRAKKPPGA